MSRNVMTPKAVAERWHCSERTVRNIIREGRLKSFRLGEKLLRIPFDAVEEYEKCMMNPSSDSSNTVDASQRNTMSRARDAASLSVRLIAARRSRD